MSKLDFFKAVKESGIMLVLGTDNYVGSLMEGDPFVLRQVLAMKQDTSKPMIILWHEIDEEGKQLVRQTFKEFKTFEFDFDGKEAPAGLKEKMFELVGKKPE